MFQGNKAYGYKGDAIYAINSQLSMLIKNTRFEAREPSSFIDSQYIETILIDLTIFELIGKIIYSPNIGTPSAVKIQDNAKLVQITSSVFKNLVGNSEDGGGALCIKENEKNEYRNN